MTASKRNSLILAVACFAAGALVVALLSGGDDQQGTGSHAAADANDGSGKTPIRTIWTCSMHPQIQQPNPGSCPICGMDLIPASTTPTSKTEARGPREISISEEARQLAKIRTVPVERRILEAEVRMVGKIASDETLTRTVAAWFPARIDRLYVDYTGIEVRAGDHLAHVYSPDLLTAQSELLSAIRYAKDTRAIRDKLRLWGLAEDRIKAIEEGGETSDRMDINSPLGGIVLHKHVNQGDYVKTGQPLFMIADLSRVWVQLDAYESDLPWLRYGQPVTFEAEAIPGRTFDGTLSFLSPTLDNRTRTVKIRVNADNPDALLKPGMFVRATVRSRVTGAGKVVAPELKGKWISPMHPEVIRDGPGPCPVCGMDLVKAEDLGYEIVTENIQPPLVVPASAVLQTGKRSLVYVELPGRDMPTYEGREIVIGARAGDSYIVEQGLAEGEQVVVEGNFKIDSALQIVARPSMMNPEGGGSGGAHDHGAHGSAPLREDKNEEQRHGKHEKQEKTPSFEVDAAFHRDLGKLLKAYFEIQKALAGDDFPGSKSAASAIATNLAEIDAGSLAGQALAFWKESQAVLGHAASKIAAAADIEAARAAFKHLDGSLTTALESLGLPADSGPIYRVYCPMAFDDRGASWLQPDEEIRNPYFGASMLRCGVVTQTLGKAATKGHEHH
jgi:Cu(I)/Ag(I) efflux system membrane fusion protein